VSIGTSVLLTREAVGRPLVSLGCGPAHVAQAVEHFLGKEKVPGSNPGVGSTTPLRLDSAFISGLLEGDGRLQYPRRSHRWLQR
jgi:hypothetical protein